MLHGMTGCTDLTRERGTLLWITCFLSTEDHRRNRKGQQTSQGTPPSHNHAPHDCASSGRPLATILSPRMERRQCFPRRIVEALGAGGPRFGERSDRGLGRRRTTVAIADCPPARLLTPYSTVNVVHMPLAKWLGMLHDRMYLPGFRFKVSEPDLPGSVSSTSPSEPALSSLNFASFSS